VPQLTPLWLLLAAAGLAAGLRMQLARRLP
jgi:hypothetical protein